MTAARTPHAMAADALLSQGHDEIAVEPAHDGVGEPPAEYVPSEWDAWVRDYPGSSSASYWGQFTTAELLDIRRRGRIEVFDRTTGGDWQPPADVPERPEVVCLCGSTRFFDEFRRQNLQLTIAGKIVLSIGCDTRSDVELFDPDCDHGGGPATRCRYCDTAAVKANLDELHKRKIDLADRVLILNVGGYIGESTRSEIAYAHEHGKPVDYLERIPR